MNSKLTIRDGSPEELTRLGQLLMRVYSALPDFPSMDEQPDYYDLLANIGRFTEKPSTRVLVAISPDGDLVGGVVYFGNMTHYGSGGTTTAVPNASGIRLLGVDPAFRNNGAAGL